MGRCRGASDRPPAQVHRHRWRDCSLGLVVGATMPAGRVKLLKILTPAHKWYTFDSAAVMAGCLLVCGLVVDGFVLSYWLYYHQGTLSPFFTRLTLFGLLLIAMAVQIGLSALLLGASFTGTGHMRRSTDVAPVAAEGVN